MTEPPYAELQLTVPAEANYLQYLRQLVHAFALASGASDEVAVDAVLASNEACANVVLHAYSEQGGPLHLHACGSEQELVIEVSDNGTPAAKPPPGRESGMGLKLIRDLCNDLDIEGPGPYGTRLEMTFRLAPNG